MTMRRSSLRVPTQTRAVVLSIVAAVGTFCLVYWTMSTGIPDIILPGIVESMENFIRWLRDTWRS